MKRILYSICIGSLALTLAARGEETNEVRKAKATRHAAAVEKTTSAKKGGQVNAQRNTSAARFNRRSQDVTPQTHSAAVRENNPRTNRVQTLRDRSVRNTNQVRARSDLTVNRERNLRVNRGGNVAVNRERNFSVNRGRNITNNRLRNVTITNNWRGERFSGRQYAAFRNYHREWHDRGWWGSHFSRITFVFGAPYYWNAGYWYPAWGYNPGYYYPYDGPIYGYNNLPPDQVVVNVQSQLQREGYYDGPIDGVLGPNTRQAIAAFQDDHGLAVTSAVDEPTLETLGLV
jgi:hypothetical protein